MVYVKQESELGIWLPNVGESVEGEVVEILMGLYGKTLTIKKEDGSLIKTPSHKVLQCKLNKVIVGDKIKIVHTAVDLPKVKGQNPTKLYDVFVDKILEEKV